MGLSRRSESQPLISRSGPITNSTKIFGVGLNKTGTSSLKLALEILGFSPAVSQAAIARAGLVHSVLVDDDYERALAWAEDYRVFEDRPWNVGDMYRRLDERFSDARFVLTVRDEESWWRSLERWLTVVKPWALPRYLAHLRIPDLSHEAAIESFRRYNAEVVAYFRIRDPQRLLVMDFAEGDGWDEMCAFLACPRPDISFPHTNRQGYRDRPPGRARARDRDPLKLGRCVACGEESQPVRPDGRSEKPESKLSWHGRLALRRANAGARRLRQRESHEGRLQRRLKRRSPGLCGEDLGVVCCYFNPMKSSSQLLNYRRFADGMQSAGVTLTTVELAFDDQPHQLGDAPGEVLRVRSGSVLWHKERLLNLGIERLLDRNVRKIAWLDADIRFLDRRWPLYVAAILETQNLCQVFGKVLVQTNAVLDPKVGVGAVKYLEDRGRLDPQKMVLARFLRRRGYPSGYSGYGWAARAELLARVPLYDACVIGGADKLMYFASFSQHRRWKTAVERWFRSANPECSSCGHQAAAARWLSHYLEWAQRWSKAVDGRVGYVDNTIGDFYHGNRASRRYNGRKEILLRQGFDPVEDLTTNEDGCLEWASGKRRMHDDVLRYFRQRRSR